MSTRELNTVALFSLVAAIFITVLLVIVDYQAFALKNVRLERNIAVMQSEVWSNATMYAVSTLSNAVVQMEKLNRK